MKLAERGLCWSLISFFSEASCSGERFSTSNMRLAGVPDGTAPWSYLGCAIGSVLPCSTVRCASFTCWVMRGATAEVCARATPQNNAAAAKEAILRETEEFSIEVID